jgi:hypoxanthine phosphoribosyltransferase
MKIKNRIYFNYEDVLTMCHDLAFQIETWKPDLLVGIKRGGVVPALHLSHHLDKPMEIITWQTRDNSHQEHNQNLIEQILDGKRVVFVDDINDSGVTITEISHVYNVNNEMHNVMFATLIEKVDTSKRSDVSSLILGNDKWIVFPWEKV